MKEQAMANIEDIIGRYLGTENASVEVLEKLIELKAYNDTNEALKSFNKAFTEFQKNRPSIEKNKEVDFKSRDGKSRTNYGYAQLWFIQSLVDPVLSEYGLSYRFDLKNLEGDIKEVTCILSHVDGYSVSTSLSSDKDSTGNKSLLQQVGSTTSFLKRYTLKAILGISEGSDDDDGGAHKDDIKDKAQKDNPVLRKQVEDLFKKKKSLCDETTTRTVNQVLDNKEVNRYAQAINHLKSLKEPNDDK